MKGTLHSCLTSVSHTFVSLVRGLAANLVPMWASLLGPQIPQMHREAVASQVNIACRSPAIIHYHSKPINRTYPYRLWIKTYNVSSRFKFVEENTMCFISQPIQYIERGLARILILGYCVTLRYYWAAFAGIQLNLVRVHQHVKHMQSCNLGCEMGSTCMLLG